DALFNAPHACAYEHIARESFDFGGIGIPSRVHLEIKAEIWRGLVFDWPSCSAVGRGYSDWLTNNPVAILIKHFDVDMMLPTRLSLCGPTSFDQLQIGLARSGVGLFHSHP